MNVDKTKSRKIQKKQKRNKRENKKLKRNKKETKEKQKRNKIHLNKTPFKRVTEENQNREQTDTENSKRLLSNVQWRAREREEKE